MTGPATGPVSAPVAVGVDGSEDSRRALRYAVELATTYAAPLRLVHVRHENVMLTPMAPLFPDPTLGEIAEHVLSTAVHDARELGWQGAEPERVLAYGPRVPAIVAHVRDARCVVLGTRSSTAGHVLTGSTTNGVAAHSVVPVVCVPDTWDDDIRFNQVTVGFDGRQESVAIVEAAASAALDIDAVVVVLHAWRPVGQYDAAVGRHGFAQRWETESRPGLERLVEPVRAAHPNVKIDVELHYERPVTALRSLSQDSDLVVIGRHARHGRLSPALGGTARTVIRTSQCPVLVVPSTQRTGTPA